MPDSNNQPRNRPRIKRDQLKEVLRANVEAFKDQEMFYDYLTDLVIYVMEYEYDWGEAPPGAARTMVDSKFDFIRPLMNEAIQSSNGPGICRVCGANLDGKIVCPNCFTRNRKN